MNPWWSVVRHSVQCLALLTFYTSTGFLPHRFWNISSWISCLKYVWTYGFISLFISRKHTSKSVFKSTDMIRICEGNGGIICGSGWVFVKPALALKIGRKNGWKIYYLKFYCIELKHLSFCFDFILSKGVKCQLTLKPYSI